MLFKLSQKNIKKSFKDYAIYFFTLILGVCIFYVFNSIDSQTAMLEVSKNTGEIIELLIELLSYTSVFVSFILGFLIIYASRFLIKKRNKEFGIYMTLGMSKRKISVLLFLETLIIGILSLVVGLLLGIALSQVTSIFIANMFEADMTKFQFNYSKDACLKTILYFGIIYFVVMIFNTIIINKNKLIDLIQASKKTEKIRLKNFTLCTILFIISIIFLGVAYYMVTGGVETLMDHDASILLVPILLGIVGTILFFLSVSGMLLKVISKCRNIYFKKLNIFTFKQLSSKINTTIVSISMICIMLFFTLCLLSSAVAIKNFFNNSITKYAPVDFEIDSSQKYTKEDILKIINSDNIIKNNIKDLTIISEYYDTNLTYGKSLGKYENEVRKKFPFVIYDTPVYIVSLSDYNKMSKVLNLDKLNLNDNEYAIVSNYEVEIYNEVLRRNSIINIFGKDLKPNSTKVIDGFDKIGGNPSNLGFFVVADNIINTTQIKNHILYGNYSAEDEEKVNYIENKLIDYQRNIETDITINTRKDIEESATGISSIVTFIGLYLGIIFLISSSAILALKELSDCLDDRNKYKTLRQIGVDEVELNKSLFKQTFIFFMMPLLLAVVHTIFGLEFCKFILSSLGIGKILNGSIVTFIFLLLIYGGYFIITYLCSKNIIKENR